MIFCVVFREKPDNPLEAGYGAMHSEVILVAEDLVSAVVQATELLEMLQKRIDDQLPAADRIKMELISIHQSHTPVLLDDEAKRQWVNLIEVEVYDEED